MTEHISFVKYKQIIHSITGIKVSSKIHYFLNKYWPPLFISYSLGVKTVHVKEAWQTLIYQPHIIFSPPQIARSTGRRVAGSFAIFLLKKLHFLEKNKPLLVNCLSILIKIHMNNDFAKWQRMILCCIKIVARVPSLVLNFLSRTQQ